MTTVYVVDINGRNVVDEDYYRNMYVPRSRKTYPLKSYLSIEDQFNMLVKHLGLKFEEVREVRQHHEESTFRIVERDKKD